jgi:hypothetical protein
MSLRETLKATVNTGVARCTPLPMQRATSGGCAATDDASARQQPASEPRESLRCSATADATGTQLPSCTTPATGTPGATRVAARPRAGTSTRTEELPAELHVAFASPCNTQLRAPRITSALVGAIHRTCDARGDDDANRAALIADAVALSIDMQADLLAHFTVETARYARL